MITTWKGCDNELYSANAKCKVCGKTCSGHSVRPADTQLKPADKRALVAAVKTAQGLFKTDAKLRIVITRGYQQTELDTDNLVGGCKPFRDEIAKLIGRDDAERYGIEWQYEQAKTPFHKIEIYEVKNEG
jgi:hypothetical protein